MAPEGRSRRSRGPGLRTRLLLIGVTGVALALLVAGLGFYQALRVATDRTLDREALTSAREVAVLVDEGRLPDALPSSGAQLVQVVDASQRVVAASLGADRLVPLLSPDQLRTALTGRAVLLDGARSGSSGLLRVRAVAAGPADAPVSVVVAVQVGDVLATRTALRTALLVVFPVVLLVMAFVAWVVMGRTLRPVEQLRAGAERIGAVPRGAGADADDRLPVPAPADEIRALALTLNGMLDRLAAARERQRAFVADAAHELRSPLTSMRVQLEVAERLGEGGDLPADLRPELDRLAALVEDLLLLARSGSDGPGPADPDVVAVGPLLVEVAASVPGRTGVVVEAPTSRGPSSDLTVLADAGELRRVLVNLTSNAVRHAAAHVRLDAVGTGGQVVLRVTDDGPGIPATDRVRVFERFTRLDDARGRDAGGSGLGLPIVAELVRRAGGEVDLTDAPGGGLRAEVRLPRHGV